MCTDCSNLSLFKHNCAHKECHNCAGGSYKLGFLLCLLPFWRAAISHTVWRAPDNSVVITSRWLRFCVFCTFGCQIKFPLTYGFTAAAVAKFCWRRCWPSQKKKKKNLFWNVHSPHLSLFRVLLFTSVILAQRGSDKNRLLALCD